MKLISFSNLHLTVKYLLHTICKWISTVTKLGRSLGVSHTLIGVNTNSDLLVNPKLGASWEGFALEQIIFHLDAQQEECYFWGTHQQAELDLLIIKNGKRLGFEIKYSGAGAIKSAGFVFFYREGREDSEENAKKALLPYS